MSRRQRNRRRSQHGWIDILQRRLSPRTWFRRHAQVALESLGRLWRNGPASAMTMAVIGIALALPAGLYLLLDNLDRLGGSWDGQVSLSVFLQDEVTTKQAQALADRIGNWDEVDDIRLVTAEAALDEFAAQTGLGSVLDSLDDNPLPAVLVITPAASHTTPAAAGALRNRLSVLPEAALAQLDLEWVQRLNAMLDTAKRGVLIISFLLALAVLLVIGNTIRLEIQNRRDEIVVTKLIGATNSFVRRPFLYSGTWYGIAGAVFAWLLVETGFWLLAEPVSRLAGLYQSEFALRTLPLLLLAVLTGGGLLLGLLGSWLAVGRHLSAIEPR